jgi:cytochrome c-type biogenesis protein CcmH
MFYIIAVVLALIAMLIVLVPLTRDSGRRDAENTGNDKRLKSTRAANIDAFRTQKRELDADFANGIIKREEFDAASAELSNRLRDELGAENEMDRAARSSKPRWILASSLAAFVASSAVAGYAMWGTPDFKIQRAEAMAAAAQAGAPGAPNADAHNGEVPDKRIVELVDQLAKKMEANPNDPKGWILLARTQHALGQFGLAVKAFERAIALEPGDAQLLADYADTLAMTQDGSMDGKPLDAVKRALKIDPNNIKALALAGTAAMRAGDKAASLKHWEKLATLVPKDSEDAQQIGAIINEIKTGKRAFGGEPTNASANANAANSSPTNASNPAPNKELQASPSKPADAGVGKSVTGTVTLAPTLRDKVRSSDTLFVFARAVNGPKMPLAVLRIPAPTSWPYKFTLTDQMSMAPGVNLSSFAEVTIEARISRGGNAQLQPGDLMGSSAAVKPPAKDVPVTIQTVAP